MPSPTRFAVRWMIAPSGAFAAMGVNRVHWECWSQCNLACDFCFRTRSVPVRGKEAERLIDIFAMHGAAKLVFAGGDPSLRRDLARLVGRAREQGLWVEVQTNGHLLTPTVADALCQADSVALSLDAGLASVHDALRGRPGNYQKVLRLMDWLEERGRTYRVRTVVTSQSLTSLNTLAVELSGRQHLRDWCLQELTRIGDAVTSWDKHAVNSAALTSACASAKKAFDGRLTFSSASGKRGAYAMVRSDGSLYGTLSPCDGAFYPVVGNLLHEDPSTVIQRLPFDEAKQLAMYA